MSFVLFTLIIQAVLANELLVTTYDKLLVAAMRTHEVTITGMDLTSYRVEDLNSLKLGNPKTRYLTVTKVSITTEYFFQLIAKFSSSLISLELNDVSVPKAQLNCNWNPPFNSLDSLTFHASNWPANEKFFSQLLRSFSNLEGLDLSNNINPQVTAKLAESLQTHTERATITTLFLENSSFKWETFLPFLEHVPNLDRLKISNNEIGAEFEKLGPMKNLLYIFAEKTSMTPWGLVHVIGSCPKLEQIVVTGHELSGLTDEHLHALKKYKRQEGEALEIDVRNMPEKTVDALKKFCDINTAYLTVRC